MKPPLSEKPAAVEFGAHRAARALSLKQAFDDIDYLVREHGAEYQQNYIVPRLIPFEGPDQIHIERNGHEETIDGVSWRVNSEAAADSLIQLFHKAFKAVPQVFVTTPAPDTHPGHREKKQYCLFLDKDVALACAASVRDFLAGTRAAESLRRQLKESAYDAPPLIMHVPAFKEVFAYCEFGNAQKANALQEALGQEPWHVDSSVIAPGAAGESYILKIPHEALMRFAEKTTGTHQRRLLQFPSGNRTGYDKSGGESSSSLLK